MSAVPELRIPAQAEPDGLGEAPRRWSVRRIAFTAGTLWMLTGVYAVTPEQQAVVTRFGAVVQRRVYPGIHFALPWPIDRVWRVRVNQLQRLAIGGDLTDGVLGRTQPLDSQFLTGDQNIIHMRVVVQYSVGAPSDYLFHPMNASKTIGASVEAELARRVARRGVDAILTTERVAIQEEVLEAAQLRLNEYGVGVKLSTINIDTIAPPPAAADAFRDVASARADTARIVDEAHGYANDLIPRARGEAVQLAQSAAAYRQTRIDEASGEAARFGALAAEYAKAADVTSTRLYLETMEQILPRIRKLVVDANGNVDLYIVGKGKP
jgi:membrane protease subunit HflK